MNKDSWDTPQIKSSEVAPKIATVGGEMGGLELKSTEELCSEVYNATLMEKELKEKKELCKKILLQRLTTSKTIDNIPRYDGGLGKANFDLRNAPGKYILDEEKFEEIYPDKMVLRPDETFAKQIRDNYESMTDEEKANSCWSYIPGKGKTISVKIIE